MPGARLRALDRLAVGKLKPPLPGQKVVSPFWKMVLRQSKRPLTFPPRPSGRYVLQIRRP